MRIRAVLFDCDGLMFNTEVVSQGIWRQIAAKYNTEIPEEFFKAITGAKSNRSYMDRFQDVPHINEIHAEMDLKRFDLDFWSSFKPDGLNKKGLVELFQYLKKNGYLTAVCSSSTKEYVKTLLDTVSVPLKFDIIVGGDMVTKGKPDPEIFLKAADMLNVVPEECMVLEDSKQGILAARNAKMHSCFIQDTIVPDEEMKAAIEYQPADLSQVMAILEQGEKDGI